MAARFLGLALWLGALWAAGPGPVDLWQAVALALLVAAAVAGAEMYLSSVRSAHALGLLVQPGPVHRALEGHWLRVLLSLVPAAAAGVGVAAAVAVGGPAALAWVSAGAVVAALAAEALWWGLRNYRPFVRRARAMAFAAVLTAVAFVVLSELVAGPGLSGLEEQPSYAGSSAVVAWAVEVAAYRAYGLAQALEALPDAVASALRMALACGYFFLVAVAGTGATLLAAPEGRRVLRVSADTVPPPAGGGTVLVAAMLATVTTLLVLQLAGSVEARLALAPVPQVDVDPAAAAPATTGPVMTGPVAPEAAPAVPGDAAAPGRSPQQQRMAWAEMRRKVERDGIGALVCEVGSVAVLKEAEARATAALAAARSGLADELHAAFDAARARVPGYLDWYYSLTGEYLRTFGVLSGDGVAYLRGQTSARLTPAAGQGLERHLQEMRLASETFRAERARVLAGCARYLPDDGAEVVFVARMASDGVPAALAAMDLTDATAERLGLRLGGSAAAGVLGGMVAAKAVGTASGKLAAKALVTFAGKKATSVGAGMLAGGAAGGAGGSAVPGVGTTLGALVGGIVGGAAIWVGVDFLALKLEEEIGREAFEADLLAAIDAAEASLLAEFGL
jgi:hypothetical protein